MSPDSVGCWRSITTHTSGSGQAPHNIECSLGEALYARSCISSCLESTDASYSVLWKTPLLFCRPGTTMSQPPCRICIPC
jgi:hypothetical protein